MGEIVSGARRLPTGELLERAAGGRGLASLGVGKGDTVALYLRNDFAFFEASFAAGLLGAYPTPVNWHYTEDEARYLFENSGAKAIVIHADLLEPVASGPAARACRCWWSRRRRRSPRPTASTRRAARVPDGHDRLEPLAGGLRAATPSDDAAAPGTIIYTSGTTGRPKGVRRQPPTAEQAAARRPDPAARLRLRRADDPSEIVTVVTGPMYHSAPNAYGLSPAPARRAR